MPRYYFDTWVGDCLFRDPYGAELPDDEAARRYAVQDVRELVGTRPGSRINVADSRVDVLDSRRRVVLSISFGDALRD